MKNILVFLTGAVIGGVAGVFGTKKYFESKYQKRYEEDRDALEEYYHRTDEYIRRNDEETGDVNQSESRQDGMMSQEERKAAKEKMKKDRGWKGSINYSGMYDKKEETEHPLDQGEEGEIGPDVCCGNCVHYNFETGECSINEEDFDPDDSCSDFTSASMETENEEAFDEHRKNLNKPPKIISYETYENLPAYIDHEILYFYAYDEMLCDDNEEPIEEPERLIGDALTKYGFIDNEERIIFVMNYAMDTCYEIQKVDASWTDSH